MKHLVFSILLLPASLITSAQNCLTQYIDSMYLKAIYFDFSGISYSHWLQPWRGYLETMPAKLYLDGLGVNLHGVTDNPQLVAQMLSTHGIRHGRLEIPWAIIDYNTGAVRPSAQTGLTTLLQACQQWNIRPLVLLNAHHGVPNPENYVPAPKTLAANASAGDTVLLLNDVTGIVPGYTGICNLTDYWAAEVIFTAINGNTVKLSKPLPYAMNAGTSLTLFTLKYMPFAVYGSPEYNATMAGWLAYADSVAAFVARALGTTQSADKGFDLEVWNELAFGSNYLNINAYYNPPYGPVNVNVVRADLVNQTAAYALARPAQFSGVRINDGIANTLPWPASSTSHERLNALGKHPYGGYRSYPAMNQGGATPINAQFGTATFSPTYSGVMPEYFLLGLQVEHIVRDMAPINTNIYSVVHGRNARIVNSQVAPVPLFITEIGIAPDEFGITDPATALALKAKVNTRLYAIYLNKGAEVVDVFAANLGDLSFGMVQDNFVNYVQTNTTYPADDAPYTSPLLKALGNITSRMQDGLDTTATAMRVITLDTICDDHNHYQFAGDGSAAHPDLYNRDVFAFLPYQVNGQKFVIQYYVMTRDVLDTLQPEAYTLSIGGVNGDAASVTAYDPINDLSVPVTVLASADTTLKVTVMAADYPYLLIIDESGTGLDQVATSLTDLRASPNPFEAFTRIQFTMSSTESVRLDVYDNVGRHVTTLVDDKLGAGTYVTPFYAGELQPGMYWCRLRAGGEMRVMAVVVGR